MTDRIESVEANHHRPVIHISNPVDEYTDSEGRQWVWIGFASQKPWGVARELLAEWNSKRFIPALGREGKFQPIKVGTIFPPRLYILRDDLDKIAEVRSAGAPTHPGHSLLRVVFDKYGETFGWASLQACAGVLEKWRTEGCRFLGWRLQGDVWKKNKLKAVSKFGVDRGMTPRDQLLYNDAQLETIRERYLRLKDGVFYVADEKYLNARAARRVFGFGMNVVEHCRRSESSPYLSGDGIACIKHLTYSHGDYVGNKLLGLNPGQEYVYRYSDLDAFAKARKKPYDPAEGDPNVMPIGQAVKETGYSNTHIRRLIEQQTIWSDTRKVRAGNRLKRTLVVNASDLYWLKRKGFIPEASGTTGERRILRDIHKTTRKIIDAQDEANTQLDRQAMLIKQAGRVSVKATRRIGAAIVKRIGTNPVVAPKPPSKTPRMTSPPKQWNEALATEAIRRFIAEPAHRCQQHILAIEQARGDAKRRAQAAADEAINVQTIGEWAGIRPGSRDKFIRKNTAYISIRKAMGLDAGGNRSNSPRPAKIGHEIAMERQAQRQHQSMLADDEAESNENEKLALLDELTQLNPSIGNQTRELLRISTAPIGKQIEQLNAAIDATKDLPKTKQKM
jgi:hypothetical protein